MKCYIDPCWTRYNGLIIRIPRRKISCRNLHAFDMLHQFKESNSFFSVLLLQPPEETRCVLLPKLWETCWAMDWIVPPSPTPPPQVHVLKPSPLMWWYLEMGLWEIIRFRWGQNPLSWDWWPYKTPASFLSLPPPIWRHNEKVTIYRLERKLSTETNHAGTFILDL